MKTLNRAQRRQIQNLNKDQLITWLAQFAMETYNDGAKDAFMSILLKLHDEFDFDNEKISKLLKASETWKQACISREDNIDSEGIKQQLISEGITCLLDADL